MPETNTLPRHVAIIMDGNGRWAQERNLPRTFGHQAGAETVRTVTTFARKRGIAYLTLYAFSTENWSRPQPEVEALMELFGQFLDHELPTMVDNDVKLAIIGEQTALSPALREKIASAIGATENNSALTLVIAINYGGRDEITRAAAKAARQLVGEGRDIDELDAEMIAGCLDSAGIPDPDLIIRTAGEQRLSNFLVWQGAYAELYFTQCRWPEFGEEDFERALAEYAGRVRKFGAL